VGWVVVAVLSVLLWVRSYWWHVGLARVSAGGNMLSVASTTGAVYLNRAQLAQLGIPRTSPPLTTGWHSESRIADFPHKGFEWRSHAGYFLITIPFWFVSALTVVIAATPWTPVQVAFVRGLIARIPYRFSLRTLLIATTLVAVTLGLLVWLAAG
jgi:hypothetical protein